MGAAAGLLGTGRDFCTSEMLLGLTGDLVKILQGNCPTIMTVGDWTAAKTKTYTDEVLPKAFKHIEKYEQFLSGDKFTSSAITLGEVDLFVTLHMHQTHCAKLVTGTCLAKFYKRMEAVPGIKKVLDGKSQW